MPIISSTYTIDAHAQANGSHWCVERHTVSDGRIITVGPYLLPAGQGDTEAQARATANAAAWDAQLAEEEFGEIVNGA